MKLLTTTREIEKEFKRLIKTYPEFYWASAWAGVGFDCFNELKRNKGKIKKIVIGTVSDNTNPDFIKTFMKTKNVRFIKNQRKGTFHPKIYLFQNSQGNWEMLIGSMNFTKGGFFDNTEVLALITRSDDKDNIYEKAKRIIENSWEIGNYFSEEELEQYKIAWKNKQRLSGKYGRGRSGRPINRVEIMNTSWDGYVGRLRAEDARDTLYQRLALLGRANELFRQYVKFSSMSDVDRKRIAGFWERQPDGINWLFFGSMKGKGTFKNRINNNDQYISLALDKIPLEGEVTKKHYENYIREFRNVFPEGNWIATSSRLLAIKRPDVFICFCNKNKRLLCREFGIRQYEMTYERYWDEIIERIKDSDWWNSHQPEDETEKKMWTGRAALLDAIYYRE